MPSHFKSQINEGAIIEGVTQTAGTLIEEAENDTLCLQRERAVWKERAFEALKRVSGPVTPTELARLGDLPIGSLTARARFFHKTFKVINKTPGSRHSAVYIDLHPDLRAYVEYEKKSN